MLRSFPLKSYSLEQRRLLLANALRCFKADVSLIPIIGAELEFFLIQDPENSTPTSLESFLRHIQQKAQTISRQEISLAKERGEGQYEIQLDHSADLLSVADSIWQLRIFITEEAALFHHRALFESKPFGNQPGNSLHVHIGLEDPSGNNMLMRVGEEPFREESPVMLHAIGGLLAAMQESMPIFSPTVDDYARFEPKYDAPTTLSWGGNNRTVAIRIPASSWLLEPTRHLEHRVPSANACPYFTFATILAGIRYGIMNNTTPATQKIYGDASMDMYQLEKLAPTLEKAKEYYQEGSIVGEFLQRCAD